MVSSRQFWRFISNWFFLELASKIPKFMEQQKRRFSDKLNTIFGQTTNVFRIETPLTWALKQWGIQNTIWDRKWDEVPRVSQQRCQRFTPQQRCQNSQIFSIVDNQVTILEPFRKFTSIWKPIGSELKLLATGRVSERYQYPKALSQFWIFFGTLLQSENPLAQE